MKKPLIILTGPTAVGKTKLSVALAKRIGGEIISADSMQVYRHMDIGSAKVTEQEMQGVRHHLIDCLEPSEPFHVVAFQAMAKAALEEIYSRGRIPVIAGGTGFYIQSVLYDIHFGESSEDPELRRRLEKLAQEEGPEALHQKLEAVDPEAAAAIHPSNIKRTIRALEYHAQTGGRISEHNAGEQLRESPYNFIYLVLNMERALLYERINARVDEMFAAGLPDEVRRLKEMGYDRSFVSMQGIGYKELFAWLDGECTLEEAREQVKLATRHFAKRQLTWFRRERDVTWVDTDGKDTETLLTEIAGLIRQKTGVI